MLLQEFEQSQAAPPEGHRLLCLCPEDQSADPTGKEALSSTTYVCQGTHLCCGHDCRHQQALWSQPSVALQAHQDALAIAHRYGAAMELQSEHLILLHVRRGRPLSGMTSETLSTRGMPTSLPGLTCSSLACAGTHSSSGALSPAESSSTCPGCLAESLQHAKHTARQQVRPLQVPSDASTPLTQPCMGTDPRDSQQGERLDSTSSSSAASPMVPSSQGSPIARAAQASGHPPADGGDDLTAHIPSTQAQPMKATADTPGLSVGAEGEGMGNRPESIPAGSTEDSAEPALCDERSDQGRTRCEAGGGHSSRTSSGMLQQRADEESDAHERVIHAGEIMSSGSSVQHSLTIRPYSGEGSAKYAKPASWDGAGPLLSGILPPQLGSPSRAHNEQQLQHSCATSAGDVEQRPAGISQSSSHVQLSEQHEHSQSRTGSASCSSAEPSPLTWAARPPLAAPSPLTQDASDGESSPNARQGLQAEGHSELSSQPSLTGKPAASNGGLSSISNDSPGPVQDKAGEDRAAESDDDLSSASDDSPGPIQEQSSEDRATGGLSSISNDSPGPIQEQATEDRATEWQGMSPEEDELSRRMRSFLARLSDNPPSARDCDSLGPGSATSLRAAHGSEGTSDRGDDVGSEQVSSLPVCLSMLIQYVPTLNPGWFRQSTLICYRVAL